MNVADILDLNVFELHTDVCSKEYEYCNIYCGDLLSMVMANAVEDNCFVTVQNNINSIAVAVLTDMKVIIFVHDMIPNKEMIDKANKENIALLSTKLDTCSVVLLLKENNLL